MAILTATNLTKSYGAVDIFSDLSLSIPERSRIGLVGPNGVGKTTLLRVLVGEESASSGSIQLTRGKQIGYLPQEARLFASHSLWQECLRAFSGLLAQQEQLRLLEEEMSRNPENSEEMLASYGRLQHAFEMAGGYTFESRIHQVLAGLGFSPEDEQRPLDQLSGGQRTRALLARLLLEEPDLLFLDEPTNHLDISAVEWLEATLKDWPGTVLIVSHDRYFLDQVCGQIWEMTPALETYKGNYSAYLQQREARYARQLAEFEAQQAFIEKEEEYIRRNIAGQNTKQAKGRRRRLERMLAEAKITPPPSQRRKMRLNLEPVNRSGNIVLRTEQLEVGYQDEGKPLFQVPDLVLERKECAAIIGPNGAGKTTFLKTILAQIPPFQGQVTLGASLEIGYFAQAHEELKPGNTLMDEISAVSPNMLPAEIRNYLAKFLFSGEDVFKPVELLSGGERGRLALAILALRGANLLLLDEPTNHLDLPSQEVLQAMLADFPGTILLVSHDRFLIDALATQIWAVKPQDAWLDVFQGSYSEYKAKEEELSVEETVLKTQETTGNHQTERQRTGLSKNERMRLEQRLQQTENEVASLEKEMHQLELDLQNPPGDSDQIRRLANHYQETQDRLASCLQQWEELAKLLEEAD